MIKSFLKLSFILINLCFVFIACNDDGISNPDKFQIGVLLPVTGAASSTGESGHAAFALAIADINDYLSLSGKDLEIELVIKDTETDPSTALARLKDLHNESIDYVIGPYTSANAESVLSYANEQDILLLSPSSVASTLAISGDNLYRLLPSDKAQAEAIAALLKYDSVELVIPVVRNDIWGTGLLADATGIFNAEGLSVVDAIIYDPSSLNTTSLANQIAAIVTNLSSSMPQKKVAVYLLSFSEGTSILSAASEMNIDADVNWYGSSAFANNNSILDDSEALEFALERKFKCPSFAPDPAMVDLWGPVNSQLTTLLGRTPEVFALTSYDALWLLVLAYQLTDDPRNHAQFESSLLELTEHYNGITGRMTLDENGDRKFASFNFWGITEIGGQYSWKSFGYYRNVDNQLVLF